MHAEVRERLILDALGARGFVSYRALEASLSASPATIRRDLVRLHGQGRIERVRGGARLAESLRGSAKAPGYALTLRQRPSTRPFITD